jgi:hypothetical protein
LDRLMMNSHPLCDGKKRWVLAISQKHLRTLHATSSAILKFESY